MADYKLILDGSRAFGVEVTAPDGFRSVRGFPTEIDALLWIAEQAARDADAAVARVRERAPAGALLERVDGRPEAP